MSDAESSMSDPKPDDLTHYMQSCARLRQELNGASATIRAQSERYQAQLKLEEELREKHDTLARQLEQAHDRITVLSQQVERLHDGQQRCVEAYKACDEELKQAKGEVAWLKQQAASDDAEIVRLREKLEVVEEAAGKTQARVRELEQERPLPETLAKALEIKDEWKRKCEQAQADLMAARKRIEELEANATK